MNQRIHVFTPAHVRVFIIKGNANVIGKFASHGPVEESVGPRPAEAAA